MCRSIIAAAAVLAVAVGLAFWAYAEGHDSAKAGDAGAKAGDDAAKADVQLIRWVNVTVELPEDSDLFVTRDFSGIESRPAILIIPLDRADTAVVIDAETGAILHDSVRREDRAALDRVLQTIRVSPLDRSTAPWPYSGEPPNVAREEFGNISYIPPDPATGIRIIVGTGDPGGVEFIEVNNGRSAFGINAGTGKVYEETARILPEDRDAFERFLSAVDHVERSR